MHTQAQTNTLTEREREKLVILGGQNAKREKRFGDNPYAPKECLQDNFFLWVD